MGCCSPCPGHPCGDEDCSSAHECNNITSWCECSVGSMTDDSGSYSGFCSNCLWIEAEFHFPGSTKPRKLKVLSTNSPCDCGVPASLKTLVGRRPSDTIANFWVNNGYSLGYRFLGWDPDGMGGQGNYNQFDKNVVFHSHWLVLPVHVSTGGGWQRKGSIWRSTGGQWLEAGNRGGYTAPDIGGGKTVYGDFRVNAGTAGGQLVQHRPTVNSY